MKDHEHIWQHRPEACYTKQKALYQCTDSECLAWGRRWFKATMRPGINAYKHGKFPGKKPDAIDAPTTRPHVYFEALASRLGCTFSTVMTGHGDE